MSRKNLLMALLALLALAVTSACTQIVPAGHLGRTREPSGFDGAVLSPGNHSCYLRCQMYLMESADKTFSVPMDVLCADNLNFKFEVSILAAVNLDNADVVKDAFEDLIPAAGFTLTGQQLFDTYIRPVVDEEARKVVSKYKTAEIVQKRAQVIEEVKAAVAAATSSSLILVKRTTVGNLDFPDVITKAQTAKAERIVEIETARAEGEKQAAQAQARITLARIQAQEKLLRAQAEADANRILAASVSPQLIMWRQWEVMEAAAGGANNMFLIPYTDAANGGLDASKWMEPQGILDAQLLKRIQEASAANAAKQKAAEVPPEPAETPVP